MNREREFVLRIAERGERRAQRREIERLAVAEFRAEKSLERGKCAISIQVMHINTESFRAIGARPGTQRLSVAGCCTWFPALRRFAPSAGMTLPLGVRNYSAAFARGALPD